MSMMDRGKYAAEPSVYELQTQVSDLERSYKAASDQAIKLQEDSNFLACLMAAGVDSWEGYEVAQQMYEEQHA